MTLPHPSPFYDELTGSQPFTLTFPLGREDMGPDWLETGELVWPEGGATDDEDIQAVALGGDRYRLAEKSFGPFSCLRLRWGDEFIAERGEGDALKITRVVMPARYRHYPWLAPAGFGKDHPVCTIVHELGGGWEAEAGGMVVLSVPVEGVGEFERRVRDGGVRGLSPD